MRKDSTKKFRTSAYISERVPARRRALNRCALLKARRAAAESAQRASVLSGCLGTDLPRQDDPTYFIRKLRDVIQRRRTTWNRNERRNSARSWLTFLPHTAVNFRSLEK